MAEAQSSGFGGSSGEYQSTAKTSFYGVSVQSTAMAPSAGPTGSGDEFETTNAIAQAGGAGQPVPNNLFQTTYAFSSALPDKAYAATLIDGASNVADALLGPRDKIFGTAILGTQGFGDSAESTFDFRFRGDLLVGLIDGSGQFSISANGVFLAERFVGDDSVINLGPNFGPNIDLTFNGSGVFVVGGSAVPEASTWAMMLAGFAGLGFAGYRRAPPTRDLAA
jgi:PEP-CTERM motif